MNRVFILSAVLLLIAGCCTTDERAALRPLPEDIGPQTYGELVHRARTQVQLATEGFYVNDWFDVEDAARALEQTARFLPRATERPEKLAKKTLTKEAEALGRQAHELRSAAREKDTKRIQNSLQFLHQKIRALIKKR